MRKAAGILMIIGGLIGGSLWLRIVRDLMTDFAKTITTADPASTAMVLGLLIVLIGYLPMGLSFVGGIYALKRKHWGLALAGSICSVLFPFLGIPAVVLLIMRKGEFNLENQSEQKALEAKETKSKVNTEKEKNEIWTLFYREIASASPEKQDELQWHAAQWDKLMKQGLSPREAHKKSRMLDYDNYLREKYEGNS